MSATKVLKVTVKHGKKKHKGVELDMDTMSFEGLQAIIFSLTQVMPERQKIILKGKQIENDSSLSLIKNKCILVIMGSDESGLNSSNLDSSNMNRQFMEDMTDADLQIANAVLPPGLYNLGNTCYLNSTLQCLKGISEFENGINSVSNGFTKELSSLFKLMSNNSDSINPTQFVQEFRTRFPEFATRNEQGVWEQQDAEECLTKILTNVNNDTSNDLIDNLFAGQFETEMKCLESNEEPIVKTNEKFLKLRCFIDSDTRHISFGIEKSMKEEITKHSNILNRNAQWNKIQKISKLPKYLTVSMVRFFWKQSKQKNAKILRSVQFDMKLDVSNFCNSILKDKIGKFRKLKMQTEDELREKKQMQGIKNENETKIQSEKNENANENENKNENNKNENTSNNEQKKTEEKETKDSMEIDDLETDYESGFYELIGLITHKGLSANSGHYIGYSKDSKRGWLKFDDDTVTEVKEDDIKKLYGGGQWQMGYVCFYKKIEPILPTDNDSK